jgi:hypothetical protein
LVLILLSLFLATMLRLLTAPRGLLMLLLGLKTLLRLHMLLGLKALLRLVALLRLHLLSAAGWRLVALGWLIMLRRSLTAPRGLLIVLLGLKTLLRLHLLTPAGWRLVALGWLIMLRRSLAAPRGLVMSLRLGMLGRSSEPLMPPGAMAAIVLLVEGAVVALAFPVCPPVGIVPYEALPVEGI